MNIKINNHLFRHFHAEWCLVSTTVTVADIVAAVNIEDYFTLLLYFSVISEINGSFRFCLTLTLLNRMLNLYIAAGIQ